jgi:hypothetical protein
MEIPRQLGRYFCTLGGKGYDALSKLIYVIEIKLKRLKM